MAVRRRVQPPYRRNGCNLVTVCQERNSFRTFRLLCQVGRKRQERPGMKPVVAIIAPGNMGAAVGGRLTTNGVKVLTSLANRGAASATRAAGAGLEAASDAEITRADFLLSIVPP